MFLNNQKSKPHRSYRIVQKLAYFPIHKQFYNNAVQIWSFEPRNSFTFCVQRILYQSASSVALWLYGNIFNHSDCNWHFCNVISIICITFGFLSCTLHGESIVNLTSFKHFRFWPSVLIVILFLFYKDCRYLKIVSACWSYSDWSMNCDSCFLALLTYSVCIVDNAYRRHSRLKLCSFILYSISCYLESLNILSVRLRFKFIYL